MSTIIDLYISYENSTNHITNNLGKVNKIEYIDSNLFTKKKNSHYNK